MTTRVVVSQRLRAPEALQERVGSQHHVLDLLNTAVTTARDSSDVLHDTLGGFGLACAGFARDNDTLILVIRVHVVVRGFCDAADVWRDLEPVLALVPLKHLVGVDAEIWSHYLSYTFCV